MTNVACAEHVTAGVTARSGFWTPLAANRDKFAADPDRYAPQFGGYCTGSLSRNIENESVPEGWIISEGKLYVFGQGKFRDIALKDPEWLRTRIPLAAANWKEKRAKK